MQKSLVILLCILQPFISRAQFRKYITDTAQTNKRTSNFITAGNKIYFDCQRLWQSDGTDKGTYTLTDTTGYNVLVGMINGKMVFRGKTLHTNLSSYIWTLDFKTGSVQLLLPSAWSNYTGGCVYDNKLYFAAYDPINGMELWYTDGTPAGTAMLTDIVPGVLGSYPSNYIVFKNKLYFCSQLSGGSNALWVTDGSRTGTKIVKTINTYDGYNCFNQPVIFKDKICFMGYNQDGFEPWVTDGTEAGTYMLANIDKTSFAPVIHTLDTSRTFTEYHDKLYFKAHIGQSQYQSQIWCTDGTKAGTVLFKKMDAEIYPYMDVMNDKLFFMSGIFINQQHLRKLWVVDDNPNGPYAIDSFTSTAISSSFSNSFTVYNNFLYFVEEYKNLGTQLWRTDGSSSAQVVLPAAYNNNALRNAERMYIYNNKLYFNANYDASGVQLWSYETFPASIASTRHDQDISIYPNPSHSSVTISASDNLSGTITLRDIAGRTILSKKIEGRYCNITLPQLAAGVYHADIETNGQHTVRKLVIE